MRWVGLYTTVAYLFLGAVTSTPLAEFYRVEEYYVEHSISSQQARNAVLYLDPNQISPAPGCKECTSEEKRYCLGPKLINDHCCCDRRYKENFPYIPHTCYLGDTLCEPHAKDCGEYTRLRTCCCDKYALQNWKMKSEGNKIKYDCITNLLLSLLMTYLFGYR